MLSEYTINILPSHKINKEKWNGCLQRSDNNIIYAQYEYLEILTDNWAGVIVNDYEAVMPLPYRVKMTLRYCYNVPFIQQLGLFGKYDKVWLENTVKKATAYIRYGDLFLNSGNEILDSFTSAKAKANYVLPLSSSYQSICKGYNRHLQTRLKGARGKGLLFVISDYNANSIVMFRQLYAKRLPQIRREDYERLNTLSEYLFQRGQCFTAAVCNSEMKVVATALFFTDEHRIYNILPSTTPEGRKLNAMHYLLDNVIRKYAETQYSLDFEGSDVEGIAAFYQSFGAVSQPYYHYHYNRLPFPLRLLKS